MREIPIYHFIQGTFQDPVDGYMQGVIFHNLPSSCQVYELQKVANYRHSTSTPEEAHKKYCAFFQPAISIDFYFLAQAYLSPRDNPTRPGAFRYHAIAIPVATLEEYSPAEILLILLKEKAFCPPEKTIEEIQQNGKNFLIKSISTKNLVKAENNYSKEWWDEKKSAFFHLIQEVLSTPLPDSFNELMWGISKPDPIHFVNLLEHLFSSIQNQKSYKITFDNIGEFLAFHFFIHYFFNKLIPNFKIFNFSNQGDYDQNFFHIYGILPGSYIDELAHLLDLKVLPPPSSDLTPKFPMFKLLYEDEIPLFRFILEKWKEKQLNPAQFMNILNTSAYAPHPSHISHFIALYKYDELKGLRKFLDEHIPSLHEKVVGLFESSVCLQNPQIVELFEILPAEFKEIFILSNENFWKEYENSQNQSFQEKLLDFILSEKERYSFIENLLTKTQNISNYLHKTIKKLKFIEFCKFVFPGIKNKIDPNNLLRIIFEHYSEEKISSCQDLNTLIIEKVIKPQNPLVEPILNYLFQKWLPSYIKGYPGDSEQLNAIKNYFKEKIKLTNRIEWTYKHNLLEEFSLFDYAEIFNELDRNFNSLSEIRKFIPPKKILLEFLNRQKEAHNKELRLNLLHNLFTQVIVKEDIKIEEEQLCSILEKLLPVYKQKNVTLNENIRKYLKNHLSLEQRVDFSYRFQVKLFDFNEILSQFIKEKETFINLLAFVPYEKRKEFFQKVQEEFDFLLNQNQKSDKKIAILSSKSEKLNHLSFPIGWFFLSERQNHSVPVDIEKIVHSVFNWKEELWEKILQFVEVKIENKIELLEKNLNKLNFENDQKISKQLKEIKETKKELQSKIKELKNYEKKVNEDLRKIYYSLESLLEKVEKNKEKKQKNKN